MSADRWAPDYIRAIRPYAPGKPAEVLADELGLPDLCQLASNENTAGPSPKAAEALAQALAGVHLYPDAGGYHLKQRLAALHDVEPGQIVLGNGSGEVIDLACRALVADGDRVVMSAPGFVQYRLSALASNAALVEVPAASTRRDDAQGFAQAALDAKLVFIANPNNPTGSYWTASELEAYFAAVPPEVVTVVDQAYHEYVEAPDYPDGLDHLRAGRTVLVLRTFSKIYGLAGLRIGYGIGPPELVSLLERVRAPYNTNSLAQVAALAALDDREYVDETRRRNTAERARLAAALWLRGLVVTPSVTNFLLVDFPPGPSPQQFHDWAGELARRGVLVRSMAGWGLPASLRITVGTPEENDRLLAALDQIPLDRTPLDLPGLAP